ncbi:MAG: glutamate---cysteine ligase / carboxylate-amine ligase, partial [Actinomycetota bacterium]|nr:glutamate---cysteine ligase / carboxylate-amine ligase [Actinomycetota bacterium]
AFMGTFIAAQAITSIREVWWDIRPHPDFGTVELRICDGIPTMREVASLAAMAQSLVESMDVRLDAGDKLFVPREWVVKQNKWKASRHGLDADLIVDDQGMREPLRDAIHELVDELSPTAARLGCLGELTANLDVLDQGASYRRQRVITAEGGTLVDVVDSLVAELESGRPGARPA